MYIHILLCFPLPFSHSEILYISYILLDPLYCIALFNPKPCTYFQMVMLNPIPGSIILINPLFQGKMFNPDDGIPAVDEETLKMFGKMCIEALQQEHYNTYILNWKLYKQKIDNFNFFNSYYINMYFCHVKDKFYFKKEEILKILHDINSEQHSVRYRKIYFIRFYLVLEFLNYLFKFCKLTIILFKH